MCGERNICHQWRLWIRPLVFVTYGAFLFGLLPYIIYRLVQTGVQSSTFAVLVGGIFVVLTIPLSIWEIVQHLINYTKPKLQKHIIRILWMVPIYSLNAWIVLMEPSMALYLDTARECYEAYVIYNFMVFLMNFLESETNLDEALSKKSNVSHIFPLCCLKTWPMGREFIHRCKHGILQYTFFHLITAFVAFLCGMTNVYGEGHFSPKYAFVYLFVVNNASQFVAMYCLVLFYRAMRQELDPMRPLAKFLCIKSVVFFSFFQGVAIILLVKAGVIKEVFGVAEEEELIKISNVLQNFLICVEMFIAAIAHRYAFSYYPYVDPDYLGVNCCHAFLLIWDISDVQSDFREHVHIVSQGMTRSLSSRSNNTTWSSISGENQASGEKTKLVRIDNQKQQPPKRRYHSTSESDIVEQIETVSKKSNSADDLRLL